MSTFTLYQEVVFDGVRAYITDIRGAEYRVCISHVTHSTWQWTTEDKLSPYLTPLQSALQRARDAEAELDRLRAAKAWDKAEAFVERLKE